MHTRSGRAENLSGSRQEHTAMELEAVLAAPPSHSAPPPTETSAGRDGVQLPSRLPAVPVLPADGFHVRPRPRPRPPRPRPVPAARRRGRDRVTDRVDGLPTRGSAAACVRPLIPVAASEPPPREPGCSLETAARHGRAVRTVPGAACAALRAAADTEAPQLEPRVSIAGACRPASRLHASAVPTDSTQHSPGNGGGALPVLFIGGTAWLECTPSAGIARVARPPCSAPPRTGGLRRPR